jgi:DNA-binding PadR family transcriptional regulator
MSRRSKYVKRITHKEERLLNQLSKTGITDRAQINEYYNINQNRLDQLENSKYIFSRNAFVGGRITQVYKLGSSGKKFCKETLGIKHLNTSQSNHMEHDLKLTYIYNNLSPEIQKTWESEAEIIADIKEKNKIIPDEYQNSRGGLKNCVDGRITVNGHVVGIEVIGASYRPSDIEIKEDIALNLADCEDIKFY